MRKIKFDTLIYGTGKAGMDLTQKIMKEKNLPTEARAAQIGVRFESPQKYFQKLIDISYDFKLYQKHYPLKFEYPEGKTREEYKKEFNNTTGLDLDQIEKQKQEENSVSIRTFCTNNNAAYVAVEETYGDISYNGHAKKGEEFRNDMTNFGILMEIKGIENPFEWSREVVKKCQIYSTQMIKNGKSFLEGGLYYSPKYTRTPSKTSENDDIKVVDIDDLNLFKESFGEYADYILNFIDQMNKIFEFGNDYGIYIPEVKYLSPEPLVNYNNLSLIDYPNVYFVGDALSARGITVSGAHGIYVASSILRIS
jgi:uncharacterized FAD-dependent dehydrogenase